MVFKGDARSLAYSSYGFSFGQEVHLDFDGDSSHNFDGL